MMFSEIIGLQHLKAHLKSTADRGRIPHAQLFVGPDGRGTLKMAMAYAQYLLCMQKKTEAERASCAQKVQKLLHPDLHFVYPTAPNKRIKSKPTALDFTPEWRNFISEQPYPDKFQWYKALGIDNKQGQISIGDAKNIAQLLSLKSFEKGFKIMIIWHAETLNISAANHLLKLIEEPPSETVFLLITDKEERVMETIRSRCQKLSFPPIGEESMVKALIEQYHCGHEEAQKYAVQAEGDFSKALQLLSETDQQFEKWFIDWVRAAFSAAGHKESILKLLSWAEEITKTNRETQKRFLGYCLDFMRQALLQNYKADTLVYAQPTHLNFKLENFAPFIHGQNIIPITNELEIALYHIERNGNAKLIFTDLSIKLTRLLHKKEQEI